MLFLNIKYKPPPIENNAFRRIFISKCQVKKLQKISSTQKRPTQIYYTQSFAYTHH